MKRKMPREGAKGAKARLFEVGVIISRTAVILATSEQDALDHVKTWEQAWEENSDFKGVSDVEVTDSRDVDLTDWDDEAHDATVGARKLIAAPKPSPPSPLRGK